MFQLVRALMKKYFHVILAQFPQRHHRVYATHSLKSFIILEVLGFPCTAVKKKNPRRPPEL